MPKKIQPVNDQRGKHQETRTKKHLDKVRETIKEKGLEDHRGKSPKRNKPNFTGDRFAKN